MNDNYYNILEIDENAGIDEIKKSYRRLSMKYHPDKNRNNPEATSKFQKISEAYETLSDEDKKREYDMTRNNPFIKMMRQNNNMNMNMNPMEDLFANIFGSGGMPFAHMQSFGPGVRIFHNGVPVNPNMLQKPIPIIKTISMPIDKILTGTTLPVDIERWLMQGQEKVFEKETIYVTIPRGIDEGEMILLQDKGNVLRDDCKGDIKLFIKIENNTEFKRHGLDLVYEKIISVKEALCGFSFELKYITGKVYTINNNSGNIINHGYNKIIPNMGLSREQHTGNLIIIFHIKFPDKLTNETLEKLKAIDF